MDRAQIISIGSELTTGMTVDTNAAFLSAELAKMGISTEQHVTVSDDLPAITASIAQAVDACEIVLVTGGIGPTADDLTREAVAKVMNVDLELRPECLEQIEAIFRKLDRRMNDANRRQAFIPEGAAAIANTCGTAPGIKAITGKATVFVMPGVPSEMKTMFARDVAPVLMGRAGGRVIANRILHCCGAGESDIGAALNDLMQRGRNPSVGTTASHGIISVRMWAHADNQKNAREMLDHTESEVRTALGKLIYGTGEETLADVVGQMLKSKRKTIATAESCSGGMLAAAITATPGASDYFLAAVVTYSNRTKTSELNVEPELIEEHGAVSEQVAVAMANGCRQHSGADYALSITGIAGPSGGSVQKPVGLVYIGLADAAHTHAHRFVFSGSRQVVRDRSIKTALNLLRLHLLAPE